MKLRIGRRLFWILLALWAGLLVVEIALGAGDAWRFCTLFALLPLYMFHNEDQRERLDREWLFPGLLGGIAIWPVLFWEDTPWAWLPVPAALMFLVGGAWRAVRHGNPTATQATEEAVKVLGILHGILMMLCSLFAGIVGVLVFATGLVTALTHALLPARVAGTTEPTNRP